jgi:hypothetical protein
VAPEQTQIGGDRLDGPVPSDHLCEWRHADGKDRKATHALPILRKLKGGRAGATVPTGQHMFCCDDHLELAQAQNEVRPSLRKK